MQFIQFNELPEHIATCDHYRETRQLFPEHEEFAILETDYFPDLSSADPRKLLDFDFRYGLSREYKAKVLLHIYKLWEDSVEPFKVPEFNSHLGRQVKLLFEFEFSRVTSALRTNSCELLLALEMLYGKDFVQSELNSSIVYTQLYNIIVNNSEEILLFIIERGYRMQAGSGDIADAINSKNVRLLKTVVSLSQFRYLDFSKITNITYEIFMYLASERFFDINTIDFGKLLDLALASSDYEKILNVCKTRPPEEVIIRSVRDSLTWGCNRWGFGDPSLYNHGAVVAEHLMNKYKEGPQGQLQVPAEVFQYALAGAFKRRKSLGRGFVLFCVKNGAVITDAILQDSIANKNINYSPAFMKSLMSEPLNE
jgi:hypothetical protein